MIKLHNARTDQVEPIQPSGDELNILLVGDMPADDLPLSQAFALSAADTLVRYLAYKGWQVNYRMALAYDGEDSRQAGQSSDLARPDRWHQQLRTFSHEAEALNWRPPDLLTATAIDDTFPAGQFPESQIDILIIAGDLNPSWNRQLTASNKADGEGDRLGRTWLNITPRPTVAESPTYPGNRPLRLRDLINNYSTDTLRIYLAQQPVQEPWTFDEAGLEKASRFSQKLNAVLTTKSTGNERINTMPAQNRFTTSMDKNLNTIKGIASLLNLADEILFRARNGYDIKDAKEVLRQMASVFSLDLNQESFKKEIAGGWDNFRQELKDKIR